MFVSYVRNGACSALTKHSCRTDAERWSCTYVIIKNLFYIIYSLVIKTIMFDAEQRSVERVYSELSIGSG